MIEADRLSERQAVHRRVERAPWSPAQVVALAIGIVFAVLGAVALARTGIHTDNLTAKHVAVAGFHHTAVLGIIELVFGLLMIAAGAIPGAGRGTMTFLGILALGFGIVVIVQATSFHRTLGVHPANGWLFVISGGLSLLAAMVSPVFFSHDRVGYAERREVLT